MHAIILILIGGFLFYFSEIDRQEAREYQEREAQLEEAQSIEEKD